MCVCKVRNSPGCSVGVFHLWHLGGQRRSKLPKAASSTSSSIPMRGRTVQVGRNDQRSTSPSGTVMFCPGECLLVVMDQILSNRRQVLSLIHYCAISCS